MYLEIIGEGCRLVEALGRAGMPVRGSCNYHLVVPSSWRSCDFLKKIFTVLALTYYDTVKIHTKQGK